LFFFYKFGFLFKGFKDWALTNTNVTSSEVRGSERANEEGDGDPEEEGSDWFCLEVEK
jgi:hypothetical protein